MHELEEIMLAMPLVIGIIIPVTLMLCFTGKPRIEEEFDDCDSDSEIAPPDDTSDEDIDSIEECDSNDNDTNSNPRLRNVYAKLDETISQIKENLRIEFEELCECKCDTSSKNE